MSQAKLQQMFKNVRARDAIADLTGAAAAMIIVPLVLGEPLAPIRSLARNFMVYGGSLVLGKQVVDLIEPRLLKMLPDPTSELMGVAERSAIAFGVATALDMALGTSMERAALMGGAVALCSVVSDYVFEYLSPGGVLSHAAFKSMTPAKKK